MPGPIASEVIESLHKEPVPIVAKEPIPVMPARPVPTYPGQAPPDSPPATPQPVYMKADPNSWLGMNPNLAKWFQFGMGGVVVIAFGLLLNDKIGSQKASDENTAKNQQLLIDVFKGAQKERSEEARTLTTSIIKTQSDLQSEIRSLAKVIEKLDAKIDGKKEEAASPPAEGPRPTKGL